jgi:hypothetical protein
MGIGAPVTEAAPTPSVTGEDGGAPVKTPGATRRLRVDPATGRLVPV